MHIQMKGTYDKAQNGKDSKAAFPSTGTSVAVGFGMHHPPSL